MDIDTASILAPAPRTDPIEIAGRDQLPVMLLTGFLGAGKTTLLNRILNGQHGLRVGVLVNDFGAINIDAELVEGVEENTINLANGCICCEIRDDLVKSLEELLSRADRIDYVVVEASGVSDPEGIVMTFLDRRYEKLLRLDSITCIVDAEAIFTEGDNEHLNMLKIRQIGFADLVILNKVDLVGPTHLEVIREWIDKQMHRVRILEARKCDVPIEILMAVGRFDPTHAVERSSEHGHGHQGHDHGHSSAEAGDFFKTWSFETDQSLSIEKLRHLVKRELPATVYRCKGIIFSTENPEKRLALQAVGRRVEIQDLGGWGERPKLNRIVAIGSGFDEIILDRQFSSCVTGE